MHSTLKDVIRIFYFLNHLMILQENIYIEPERFTNG